MSELLCLIFLSDGLTPAQCVILLLLCGVSDIVIAVWCV